MYCVRGEEITGYTKEWARPAVPCYAVVCLFVCLFVLLGTAVRQSWASQPSSNLYTQAQQALQQQRYAKVMELYRHSLKQGEPDPAWTFLLGHSLFRQGQYEHAFQSYQRGLHSLPKQYHAWLWNNMGNVRWQQGQLQHAVRCYVEALKQDPQYQRARYNLEKALEELHKRKQKQNSPPPPSRKPRQKPPRQKKTKPPPPPTKPSSSDKIKTPQDTTFRLDDFDQFIPYSSIRRKKSK